MINWSMLCAQNGVWYSRGTASSRCPRHMVRCCLIASLYFFLHDQLDRLDQVPLLKLVNLVNLVMQKIALFIFFEPYVRKCSISYS